MLRISITICLILFMSVPALAHKVSIFGYAEQGKIYTESYYAGGSRCLSCPVVAIDIQTGQTITQGKTDSEGRFDFDYNATAPVRLTVDAGGGHTGSFTVEPETTLQSGGPEHLHDGQETIQAEPEELEAMLEKKLSPIRKELVSLREATERPGLTEVLGGIGYIIGLMGLWMYLKNRSNGK